MFKQVGDRRNKLSTLVRFPLTALNMAPHVAKSSQSMKNLHTGFSASSRKQASGHTPQPDELLLPQDCLYDLYAVCNHHGGMHGGHYTGMKLGVRMQQKYLTCSKLFYLKHKNNNNPDCS